MVRKPKEFAPSPEASSVSPPQQETVARPTETASLASPTVAGPSLLAIGVDSAATSSSAASSSFKTAAAAVIHRAVSSAATATVVHHEASSAVAATVIHHAASSSRAHEDEDNKQNKSQFETMQPDGTMCREQYFYCFAAALADSSVARLSEIWVTLCGLRFSDTAKYRIKTQPGSDGSSRLIFVEQKLKEEGEKEDAVDLTGESSEPAGRVTRVRFADQVAVRNAEIYVADEAILQEIARQQAKRGQSYQGKFKVRRQTRGSAKGKGRAIRSDSAEEVWQRILVVVCQDKEHDAPWQWEQRATEEDVKDWPATSIDMKHQLWLSHPPDQGHLPLMGITVMGGSFRIWQSWYLLGSAAAEAQRELSQRSDSNETDAADFMKQRTQAIFDEVKVLRYDYGKAARRSKDPQLPEIFRRLYPNVRAISDKIFIGSTLAADIVHNAFFDAAEYSLQPDGAEYVSIDAASRTASMLRTIQSVTAFKE